MNTLAVSEEEEEEKEDEEKVVSSSLKSIDYRIMSI